MKLQALFRAENNKLFRIEDNKEFIVTGCTVKKAENCQGEAAANEFTEEFFAIDVPWTLVGTDEDSYNEQFLSDFRDYLKILDEKKIFVYINPVADKVPETAIQREDFVASFKHCARRIKDCQSVVGFAINPCADSQLFMEELSAKHSHYIYFSKDKELLKNEGIVIN